MTPAPAPPPPGFDVIERGAAHCWVRPEARAWIESVLHTAPTIHAAAARLGSASLSGRGPVYAVPSSEGLWVVRHYRRGGAVAPILGDRYVRGTAPRPFREAVASERVRARGVETPRVVAAAVYRTGPLYRGDLVTELVPDAEDLATVLFGPGQSGLAGTATRKQALREAGAVVAGLARAGVRHADLNAKNILLRWMGGAPTGYVLDLDRATVSPHRISPDPMLRRLRRSLRKFERRTGLRLPSPEYDLLAGAALGDGG